jgi:protein-L-isoaspartate(D-aspartate) O-methyltransferase
MSRAASPPDLVAAARAAGIADARVLEAIGATPRAGFVPADYLTAAYRDEPIPIGHRQGDHAAFAAGPDDRGPAPGRRRPRARDRRRPGLQTALLARLAARVMSIERWPDLADQARRNLARQGLGNAEVLAGDGSRGLPEGAPYDAILVSAAFPQVPAPLAAQLPSRS